VIAVTIDEGSRTFQSLPAIQSVEGAYTCEPDLRPAFFAGRFEPATIPRVSKGNRGVSDPEF